MKRTNSAAAGSDHGSLPLPTRHGGSSTPVEGGLSRFTRRVLNVMFVDEAPALSTKKPRRPIIERPQGRLGVLVIDVSPSMLETDWEPSRLDAAKDAAIAYIRRLAAEENDARVAVLAYSGEARVVCSPTAVGEHHRVARRIVRLSTGWATNITSGLQAALKLTKRHSERRCQILCLTDGHHNSGPKPHRVATRLRSVGVLEIIGIGGSPKEVDEGLLRSLASSHPDGSKRYRWIGERDRLVQHFRELAGRITR